MAVGPLASETNTSQYLEEHCDEYKWFPIQKWKKEQKTSAIGNWNLVLTWLTQKCYLAEHCIEDSLVGRVLRLEQAAQRGCVPLSSPEVLKTKLGKSLSNLVWL